MLGYVLVSNKNEVISFGGDDRFDDFLRERLHSPNPFSSDTPSTSSGVHTDSSIESLCVDDKTPVSADVHEIKDSSPLTNYEVAHLFLPIIAVYRTRKAVQCDSVFSMISEHIAIFLKRLRSNYLLISVGNSEKLQHQFVEYMELGLEVNTGPLIELLHTDPSSMVRGWKFLNSFTVGRRINDGTKVKACIDVRKAIFFNAELSVTLPLLNALSLHLHEVLGSNRCLLLGNGDLLSSVSAISDENTLWKSIVASDLNFLSKQISTNVTRKNDELFQIWLRSTKSVIPYFVDVMVYNIGGGFKIVCLFEAKYNALIRTITAFLVQIDRIQFSDDIVKEICEIGKTVESIAQQLLAFSSSNPSRRSTGGGFTKNPERTAYFIESLWQRTADLLLASSGCYTYNPDRPRSNTNISMGSLISAISSLSLNSTATSLPTPKKFKATLKCEITMEYCRRQAVSILQELCSESHWLSAPHKLAHFRKIVSRIVDTREGSVWSDIQQAMTSEKRSAQFNDFMSPIVLGLDMIAYSVTIPAKSFSVTYTPEWVRDEFDFLRCSSCSNLMDLVGKSTKRYILIRVRSIQKRPASWMNVLKSFRTYLNGISASDDGECVYAVALFEEGINKGLAEREVLRLIEIVTSEMYSTFSFMY